MHCILTIVRYPKYKSFAGLLSMALFRLPLIFNKKISFWKLMGCGRNGTFDIHPDWRQWAVLSVGNWQLPVGSEPFAIGSNEYSVSDKDYVLSTAYCKLFYGSFINWWWKIFDCEIYTIILEPIEGYGTWDDKKIFGKLPRETNYEGTIAVLTRATIRLKRLKNFWQHVDGVALKMRSASGLVMSVGIGEIPWIRQATFSVWQNKEAMKMFAYKTQQHTEVIHKTREENWYSEEMFVRFKLVASSGTLNGNNPLKGKL